MTTGLYILDLFGVAVFAISGALLAGRLHLDAFGVIVLASVTGIGGGTVRDAILGATPVFWIQDPTYLFVCIAAGLLTAVLAHRVKRIPGYWLLLADAFGLALFAILGAQKALDFGTSGFIAVVLGTMTGAAGGMIRDILGHQLPLIMQREIYATAAILGASVYVVLLPHLATELAMLLGITAGLVLRLAAMRWHLQLPRFVLPAGQQS